MCTLSWQIHKDHLNLVFNRDELRSRPMANSPVEREVDGVRFIAPIDSKAGGTWITANHFGLVITLLNNYRIPPAPLKTGEYLSRGQLVLQLASAKSVSEVSLLLESVNLSSWPPFDLLVFPGMRHPHQWSWDGTKLMEIIAPASPVVSSSLHPGLVSRLRKAMFRRAEQKTEHWIRRPLSLNQQLAIHKSRIPFLPAYSIAIKRKDRGTVSLTHVRLDAEKITMNYEPGDPADNENPVFTKQLSLVKTLENIRGHRPGPPAASVDYKKLMREKNRSLHDALPVPAFFLIRIAGLQKTVNRVISEFQDVHAQNFPQTILNHIGVHGKLWPSGHGMPPAEARPVFVANHPTGGLDGLLMLSWLIRHYSSVKMIVTDLLEHIPQLRPFIIPVDLYNYSRNSADALHKAFAGDEVLLLFPAGRTGRKYNGVVRDAPWNKMPVRLARQYHRTIVPVYIDSSNSRKFNAVAWLRRMAGISLNLEMMLLVREFFKPAEREFKLYAGKPVTPDLLQSLGENDRNRLAELRGMHDRLTANYLTETA